MVRLGPAVSTLLGPEGTTSPAVPGVRWCRGSGGAGVRWCRGPVVSGVVVSARHGGRGTSATVVVLVFFGRSWVGRWLRIAQWTRASLFSVVNVVCG